MPAPLHPASSRAGVPRVLLLGATGQLAGLTARRLAARDDLQLRLASSRDEGCARLRAAHPGADVVKADWYDEPGLTRALHGVDRVLVVPPDFVTDESVTTPHLIEAVRRNGGQAHIVRLIALPPGLPADHFRPEYLATRAGANLSVVAKPLLDASGLTLTYVNVPCWIMFNLGWFFADQVKQHRRIAMPMHTDMPRLWLSEDDIADVLSKVLIEGPEAHGGLAHVLTGRERYDYARVARLLGEVVGEPVSLVDDDKPLRALAGANFGHLMTYFRHEVVAYRGVQPTDTVERLLGRPPVSLSDYARARRHELI